MVCRTLCGDDLALSAENCLGWAPAMLLSCSVCTIVQNTNKQKNCNNDVAVVTYFICTLVASLRASGKVFFTLLES